MKFTLTNQIRKFYFLGFLLITLISGISFAVLSSMVYKNQTREFSKEILKLNISLLDNKFLEIQENQKMIVNDGRIKEIIKYRKENRKLDYSIELYNQRAVMERFNLLLNNLKVDNAYIINKEGDVYYSFGASIKENKIKDNEWFNKIVQTAVLGTSYISDIHSDDYILMNSSKKYISVVMPFSRFDGVPEEYLVYDIALENMIYSAVYDDITAFLKGNNDLYMINDGKIQEYDIGKFKSIGALEKYLSMKIFEKENILITRVQSKLFGLEILGIKTLTEIK